MSTIKDGGPAFPVECFYPSDGSAVRGTQTSGHTGWEMGMTLRDYFAAKAMQGMLANPKTSKAHTHRSFQERDECMFHRAEVAYALADAMLRAREVQP